jgi:16S rRNA (uracil1498-N3)-methyltransferase
LNMLFYLPDFSKPVLPESDALHVLKVLRKKKGDWIEVCEGQGGKAKARIESTDLKNCLLHLSETEHIPKQAQGEIWLAVAPTKQMERMEWMVEKCTEIGVDGFVFFQATRSERNSLKLERLQKVAISAMKQSGQVWLPPVFWYPDWKQFPWQEFQTIFVADLEENAEDQLIAGPGKNLIMIGPEGDFSPDEYAEIRQHQARRVRLLPQILRTETAALFALCQAQTLRK